MRRLGVVSQQQAGLPDPRHAQLQYPLHPLRCQNPHRPNVLMVVLESLRQDVLTPQLMPNTSALAQDACSTSTSAPAMPPAGLFGVAVRPARWLLAKHARRAARLAAVPGAGQQGYDRTCAAAAARNSIARHSPMCATSCTRAIGTEVRRPRPRDHQCTAAGHPRQPGGAAPVVWLRVPRLHPRAVPHARWLPPVATPMADIDFLTRPGA